MTTPIKIEVKINEEQYAYDISANGSFLFSIRAGPDTNPEELIATIRRMMEEEPDPYHRLNPSNVRTVIGTLKVMSFSFDDRGQKAMARIIDTVRVLLEKQAAEIERLTKEKD